ncbi:LuxR C-terminal-related transcriptional regulator [Streptomyces sp. NPDC006743]|uniref:helix-turn-helix transcriptional regulator n=1 Tax=Streptomyces sp. NPDC006743 TaxID=3154480 RepID=UPI0034536980
MENQLSMRPDDRRTIPRTTLEALPDYDALASLLDTLRHRTVREFRLALPRRPYEPRVRERLTSLSAELVRRGARIRALHLADVGCDPAYAGDIRRIAATGAAVRALPRLPVWMAVADRDLAVVPSEPGPAGSPATLLRGRVLVGAYQALFDQVWARSALSPAAADAPGHGVPAGRDREVLALLSEGLTDEGISRRTGLSVRTVRRTIAAVMVRMGAQSRFQAGVEAARRQWI